MSDSSDAGLRDRRRAPLATTTTAATSTSTPFKSHWLMTLSAGEAANNVISGDGPEHEHG